MDTLTVEVEIHASIGNLLNVPKSELSGALKQLIALELFREGHISAGKGAEIMGIRKWEFIQLLSKLGIDYITQTPEELLADVAKIQKFLDEKNAL